MRFLHTGDLHLGKQLNDVSLLEDQRHILGQLLDIAISEKADAVLIAGDIYQKSVPQAEAMALFDSFLTSLAENCIKVFLISGKHDSSMRISYFSSLVRASGIYASENFEGKLQTVRLQDEHGDICIHLMPFIKPIHARRWLPDAPIASYQDAVAAVLANSPIDESCRNVLLCHQFITGSETCDSEESAVGGLDNISADIFSAFDYVALGHIHKPQPMLRQTLRYSGSPLKYSFSEVNHKKSAAIVDIGKKGEIEIKTVPLVPMRDMRLVEGMFDDLINSHVSDDYVWVTLNDELPPPDARLSLTAVFPNMLKFSISNSKTRTDVDVLRADAVESMSVEELFTDFYRWQNNDAAPSEAHMRTLEEILKEVEEDRHEAR